MKLKFLPRKINIALLIFFILLGVTGIFLEKFSSVWGNPFRTLGEYLIFSFLPAAILLSVIGFQSGIKNEFLKSLLHGYTIALILAAFSSVFLPIVTRGGLGDIAFLTGIVLYLYWIFLIYVILTAIVLFFVRKLKSKKYLRLGYWIVIAVLGTCFCIGHYIIARAAMEAIYIGIMTSRWRRFGSLACPIHIFIRNFSRKVLT